MTHRYYMSNGAPWTVFNAEHVNSPEHFRLVAVIDPTDREAVERLIRLQVGASAGCPDALEVSEKQIDRMAAALREFADPTPPRPEEPTGLGAVVEDAEGRRYVRVNSSVLPWVTSSDDAIDYADLAVVKVLSEGVTA